MCRYYNHLRPNIDKSPWTREEDAKMLKLNQLYGHKWTLISGFFSRRTQGSVKNRSVPTLLFTNLIPPLTCPPLQLTNRTNSKRTVHRRFYSLKRRHEREARRKVCDGLTAIIAFFISISPIHTTSLHRRPRVSNRPSRFCSRGLCSSEPHPLHLCRTSWPCLR